MNSRNETDKPYGGYVTMTVFLKVIFGMIAGFGVVITIAASIFSHMESRFHEHGSLDGHATMTARMESIQTTVAPGIMRIEKMLEGIRSQVNQNSLDVAELKANIQHLSRDGK